jgi:hypothetical protein
VPNKGDIPSICDDNAARNTAHKFDSELSESRDRLIHIEDAARWAADDAQYKEKGLLPIDFGIDERTASKELPFTIHEQAVSEAVERIPPLSDTLKAAPYSSWTKLNVQISNVPEVSKAVMGGDILRSFKTAAQTGADAISPIVHYIGTPAAIKEDLIRARRILMGIPKYFAQNPDVIMTDIEDAVKGTIQQAADLSEQVDKPMTAEHRAQMSGSLALFVLTDGQLIGRRSATSMELDQMTEEQLTKLGIKRYEMPKLQLYQDECSMQATISGDDRAWVRACVPQRGVVEVANIDLGALPGETGGEFLAQTLREFHVMPTQKLIFADIENASTAEAFRSGIDPAKSTLGRVGASALESLGLEAKSYRFESIGNELNLIIDVK